MSLGCQVAFPREPLETGKTDDEKASNLQKSAMAFMRVVAVYGNSSDKRILAADGAIQCFDKLASFQSRIESLKGIPYGRYSMTIKQWKTAQGAEVPAFRGSSRSRSRIHATKVRRSSISSQSSAESRIRA